MLHYEAGVGTRRGERFLGGVFGVGLSRNVQDCYRFLVDNYEPGDKLYFFGFSRGAYTARSTVGLVRNAASCGPSTGIGSRRRTRSIATRDKDSQPSGIAAELFRRSYSYSEIYVDFIGVWDTVGALGIPIDGFRPPFLSRLWSFHDTKLSRYVLNAYHALAIDERRRPFKPTLWVQQDDAQDQTLEQVWFAGVHCDVGGGYSDPGLSEIPLLWMAEKARSCGLALQARPPRPDRDECADATARRAGDSGGAELRRCAAQLSQGDSISCSLRTTADWQETTGRRGRRRVGLQRQDALRRRRASRPPGLSDWLATGKPIAETHDSP